MRDAGGRVRTRIASLPPTSRILYPSASIRVSLRQYDTQRLGQYL
jgi:hypothetical protein